MFQPATRNAALAISGSHTKVDDEVASGPQVFYRGMFAHYQHADIDSDVVTSDKSHLETRDRQHRLYNN